MPYDLLDYLVPAVIFVVVASGFFSLIYRLLEKHPPAAAGGNDSPPAPVGWDEREELLLGELTGPLAAQIPTAESTRLDIERELRSAGYYGRKAFLEYSAVRTILVLVPLVAAGILALGVETDQMAKVVIGGLVAAILGYSLPRVYIYYRGRERTRNLEAAMPVAVDMLMLCLGAGQTLMSALARTAQELGGSHPLMAAELAITRRHAELSHLPHALKQLADRVPAGEMRNLAVILAQAEKLGSETASALQEFSDHLRTTLKQRAETRANQTMFWMLFPTILCLWIPAAILLVGPAVLEFRTERSAIFGQWRASREQIKNLRPGSPAPTTPGAAHPASAPNQPAPPARE
jgi:tight adherence protein C